MIITLALCIGVNTTILSALYSFVLKPLPVENPERLVQLFNIRADRNSGNSYSSSSWNQYLDFKERTDLFEGCALRYAITELVSYDSSVRRVKGQKVSAGFFDLMGAKPLLGRFFLPEEVDPTGPANVVVLTQTAWENEYDADPNVIGKQIRFDDFIDGRIYCTIIGVAPRSMEAFDFDARYFAPYKFLNRDMGNPAKVRYLGPCDLWIRLKPEVSREVALEQIQAIERRWFEEVADTRAQASYKDYDRSVEFDLPHPLEGSLYLLEGGSFFVLLVGCFNVMTLVLSRVNQKRHELSIRNALGAGKSRLRRLMLVESVLLIAGAVGVGIVLAWGRDTCYQWISEYSRSSYNAD